MEVRLTPEGILGPETDQLLLALSHHQRRLILLLMNHGHIDNQRDLLIRSGEDSNQLALDLKNNHLPKLAEAEIIEWNPETGEIKKGPRFEEIKPILELIENHPD